MSIIFAWCMYFLSFIPLWIAVIFVDVRSMMNNSINTATEKISIMLVVIGVIVSVSYVLHYLQSAKAEKKTVRTILKIKEQKTVTADYILAYILPLFAFDFTEWEQVVLFLIFFLTLGLLCVRHHHLILNVVLDLANYRLYECTCKTVDGIEGEAIVLSRDKISTLSGKARHLFKLNDDYYIDQDV